MNHKHCFHHMAPALGFCAVLASPGRAENQTATPEQWENAIRIVENQVAMQQDRLDTVVTQWKAPDRQIERRMERVLAQVVQAADTPDSGTKIVRTKSELFDGLMKGIEFYASERSQRLTSLYRPMSRGMQEGVAADVTWLNQRIEKRVQQALEMVSSLPADNQTQQHRQEAHAQNKLLREKAIARLKMSTDRLRRSRSELERALSYVRTAEEKTFIKGLIAENDELVAQRDERLERALMQTAAKSKPLGKSAVLGRVFHQLTPRQIAEGTIKTIAVRKDGDLCQRKIGEEVVLRSAEAVVILVEKQPTNRK